MYTDLTAGVISAVSHSFELKEYGFSNWGYLTAIAVIGIVFSFILLSYYLIILLSYYLTLYLVA